MMYLNDIANYGIINKKTLSEFITNLYTINYIDIKSGNAKIEIEFNFLPYFEEVEETGGKTRLIDKPSIFKFYKEGNLVTSFELPNSIYLDKTNFDKDVSKSELYFLKSELNSSINISRIMIQNKLKSAFIDFFDANLPGLSMKLFTRHGSFDIN